MPQKRTYRKKKNYNKKRIMYKKPISRIPRVPRSKMLSFKRDFELPVVALENNLTWPEGWYRSGNSIVVTQVYSLNQLPGYSEFKNLFRSYKINYAVMRMYPSSSQIVSQNVSNTGTIGVANFTVTTWQNLTGQPLLPAFTDALLNQIPAKKRRLFPTGKPLVMGTKLVQMASTYNQQQESVTVTDTAGVNQTVLTPFNIDYARRRPKFINTVEDSTPHYGLNMHFKKTDDSFFDTHSPRLKIFVTLYFQCLGIQ